MKVRKTFIPKNIKFTSVFQNNCIPCSQTLEKLDENAGKIEDSYDENEEENYGYGDIYDGEFYEDY